MKSFLLLIYLATLTSGLENLEHQRHRITHTLSHRMTHKLTHRLSHKIRQRSRLRDTDEDDVDVDAINAQQTSDFQNIPITTLYGEKLNYNEFAELEANDV